VFEPDDTIVAIATPHGRGGIGVVRISGPQAPAIAARLTQTELEPRYATFARVIDPTSGAVLDQVVATRFVGPHSYTGEDVVEISAHGSPVLLKHIVELAIAGGARLAEPGEFTLRAYLHGRMDLAQAEAVADLVDAVTPLQARAAMDQLAGTLTSAIAQIDLRLFDLCARLEASLDYPDEGFHFVTSDAAAAEIAQVRADLDALAARGRAGRVIREGRTVVIAGPPNAGKSSLFNALLGTPRAIVTAIPGTTRDLLTETVDIGGIPVTLVDTAGLRKTADEIEAAGVRLAERAQDVAALTLLVIDRSRPIEISDRALIEETRAPRVLVASKSDLPAAAPTGELAGAISVSALTGDGLDDLRARIVMELCGQDDLRDAPAISNVRHLALVGRARSAMADADAALQSGATEELVLADLTRARQALEEITGRRTADDLLAAIFSRFCLGK